MKNSVTCEGKVKTVPEFDHKSGKKGYLKFILVCRRKSGFEDEIPVVVEKKMAEKLHIIMDAFIKVKGRFESYNSIQTENYGKRILYIMASKVELCKKKDNKNEVLLEGIVCKPTTYRTTPKGKRVCDLILKNYSDDGKSIYYLPCICWYKEAVRASLFEVGEHISLRGRLQSRDFIRLGECRTTYEVSVSDIKNN